MINLAINSPPEKITISGVDYPINTDYRIWLRVSELLQNIDSSDDTTEGILKNLQVLLTIKKLVFGKRIEVSAHEMMNAMFTFMQGYPREESSSLENSDDKEEIQESIVSFSHDINYIILAIRNQSGIDLSYQRKEPFHWWLFLLEFESLEEHHMIKKIMQYRAYTGTDTELLKLKRQFEIPKKISKAEEKIAKKYDDIFYNT